MESSATAPTSFITPSACLAPPSGDSRICRMVHRTFASTPARSCSFAGSPGATPPGQAGCFVGALAHERRHPSALLTQDRSTKGYSPFVPTSRLPGASTRPRRSRRRAGMRIGARTTLALLGGPCQLTTLRRARRCHRMGRTTRHADPCCSSPIESITPGRAVESTFADTLEPTGPSPRRPAVGQARDLLHARREARTPKALWPADFETMLLTDRERPAWYLARHVAGGCRGRGGIAGG